MLRWSARRKHVFYSALQVSCLAGVVNEQLSMSLYKLIAFVLCTITELSHCLFTLSSGQLSCKALYKIVLVQEQVHTLPLGLPQNLHLDY